MTLHPTAYVGDRYISLSPSALLQVVTIVDGDPTLINLDEAPNGDEEFTTLGMIMTDDMIKSNGLHKVFEIDPIALDSVVIRAEDGSFIQGLVVAASTNLVTISPAKGGDNITANKKTAYVLAPMPRDGQKLSEEQVVVVINPFHERYSQIGGVISTTADASGKTLPKGRVLIEFRDNSSAVIRVDNLAPYTLNERVTVLGTDVLRDEEQSADISTFFGAEFEPANVTIGADRSDPKNAVGEVFSVHEMALLSQVGMTDDDDMANMLGIVINEGRTISSTVLQHLLDEAIPYGFSIYIDDPKAFFATVGEIAKQQAERNLEAIFRGELPEDFAAPTEIAFSRIVGYTPEELHIPGRPNGTQNAPGAAAPPPVPEAADEARLASLALLDAQFGAGNYRLLTAEEAIDVFGPSVLEDIQNGDLFGEILNPESLRDPAEGTDAELTAFLDSLLSGLNADAPPSVTLPPKRNTVADAIQSLQEVDPKIDIDECLIEFDTLAKAGQTDSRILSRQIDEAMDRSRTIETMIVEDLNKALDAFSAIQAGLKLLVENRIEAGRLAGNATMVSDAFEALSADVTNLQRLRANT